MSWVCRHGFKSIAYTRKCPRGCIRDDYEVTDDWLSNLIRERKMSKDNGDLFASFFNPEKILVKDMDSTALRAHREQLAMIAFEAKARISACDEELRERESRMPPEQRSWIVPSNLPDPNVTNAINAVKSRSERMSKAEKLRKQLESAGISDEDIRELMVKLPGNTEYKVKPFGITFNRATLERADESNGNGKNEHIKQMEQVVEENKPKANFNPFAKN